MTRASLLALLVACRPLPPAGSAPAELAHGLPRVVLLPDDGATAIYLQATLLAGSAHDPLGQEGLARLMARAMVEGGAGERDPEAVREALYRTGNGLEVVVGKEQTSLRLRCPREHAAACVELFADVLTAPRFDADVVRRLRDEALHEVTGGLRSDEEALAADVLDAWLFEGHPYGHPDAGRAGALPMLGRDDVAAFHRRHAVRQGVVLGVAGAAEPALVHALMERARALTEEVPPELALLRPVPLEGRSLLVVETGAEVLGVRLGHPVDLRRDHPDFVAMHLAFTAFGGHQEGFGTLYRELSGRRGLNDGAYAYVEAFAQRPGTVLPEQGVVRRQPTMHLWVRPTSPDNAPFALKLAVAELERLAEEGLSEQDFESTRSHLLGALPLLAREPGRRLAYAVEAVAAGVPDPLRDLPARLATLTREQVNDALRRHLRPGELRIVAVGGGGEALVAALTADAPTPPSYADGFVPDAAQRARDVEIAESMLGLLSTTVRPVDGIFR